MDGRGLALSGGEARSLLASGHCLGDGELPDSGVGHGGAHHGRGTPTTGARRGASNGPWVSVRRHPVPRGAGRSRPDGEHESGGNCGDNAVVESFFHALKTEHVHHQRYRTREEARQDIFKWIEVFYNRVRRHLTLGYRSPAEFEAMATGS